MKKSTSIIGGILFVGAWLIIDTSGDQTWMQELHRDVGRSVTCEKTKNLYDRTWMACRYPGREDENAGTVWVMHEDSEGEVWIARNGPAIQVIDRFNQLAPEDQSKQIRIYRTTLEENIELGLNSIPSVPWEELN